MRKVWIFIGIVALMLLCGGLVWERSGLAKSTSPVGTEATQAVSTSTTSTDFHTITVAGHSVSVTIANTASAREKGLGGRAGLAPDEGMLFVFPQDGVYSFWMKDMRFSIDIIWISSAGHIVHIVPNLSPSSYPKAFAAHTPARYVLEVSTGYAHAHGLKIGDMVHL